MSIEMKITGANPAEIAAAITGLYGMLHIGKLVQPPAPHILDRGEPAPAVNAEATQNPAPETTTNAPAEPVAEAPKRGRPKKNAEPVPTIEGQIAIRDGDTTSSTAAEARKNLQPEPEKQIDIEEAIAAPPEPKPEPRVVDDKMLRNAIINLGNLGKVKAAPDVQEAMRKAVGAAYQEFDAAGVARGEKALPELKLSHIPAERYEEFLAIIERRTATMEALADGTWTGA